MTRSDAAKACENMGKSLATIETTVAGMFATKYLNQRKFNIQ